MNWQEVPRGEFTYNGKLVRRRKVIFKSVFGMFEVFEAVSGRCFIRHPFLENDYINPITGFNNGCEDWFGAPKKEVQSMGLGLNECEKAMDKAKKIVQSY